MSGWIKLHRKLTDWEWYSDVNTTRVFLHLLLVANHKDKKWRGIDIKRGQKLTSLSKLADETNLSIKNIRTAIKRLKTTNEVASYSTAQHTVFTMVNYDLYQSEAHEVANEWQASGTQGATNKNVKNVKNDNNKPIVQPKAKQNKFTEFDLENAKWMSGLIDNLNPNRKQPNFESWAEDIRKMREIDKRSIEEVQRVFSWANSDSFWQSNILSPSKLRSKFDDLVIKSKSSNGKSNLAIDTSQIDYQGGAM